MMNSKSLGEHIVDIIWAGRIERDNSFELRLFRAEYFKTLDKLNSGFSDYVRLKSSIRRNILRLSVEDSFEYINFNSQEYFNVASMEKLTDQKRLEVTSRILEEL
jgi:hypothetical protein